MGCVIPSYKTIDMNTGLLSHYQPKVWEKKKRLVLGRTGQQRREKKCLPLEVYFLLPLREPLVFLPVTLSTLPFCPNWGSFPSLLCDFLTWWGSRSDSNAFFFPIWLASGRNHLLPGCRNLGRLWQTRNERLQVGDTRGREMVRKPWGWLLG